MVLVLFSLLGFTYDFLPDQPVGQVEQVNPSKPPYIAKEIDTPPASR